MAKDSTRHDYRRWARKRTNQELSDFIARSPKAAGRLAASLFRENYVPPKTNNLKRRREGRETYSPNGKDSV